MLAGNKGIQTGHVNDDMNVRLETITLPVTTWLPMPAGRKINGTTYTHVIDTSGDYRVSGITGSVSVNSNVTARIHVTGDVSLTGKNDEIRLAAVGTKVTLDMGGTTFKMNGHFNFHYDEALSRLGGDRGFLPVSWAELN